MGLLGTDDAQFTWARSWFNNEAEFSLIFLSHQDHIVSPQHPLCGDDSPVVLIFFIFRVWRATWRLWLLWIYWRLCQNLATLAYLAKVSPWNANFLLQLRSKIVGHITKSQCSLWDMHVCPAIILGFQELRRVVVSWKINHLLHLVLDIIFILEQIDFLLVIDYEKALRDFLFNIVLHVVIIIFESNKLATS